MLQDQRKQGCSAGEMAGSRIRLVEGSFGSASAAGVVLGSSGAAKAVGSWQVAGLPVVLDVPSAGPLLGIGRTRAYRLARSGVFPCQVFRVGRSWRVPTADLLALLGLTGSSEAPASEGVMALDGNSPQCSGTSGRRTAVRPVASPRRVG
ncbi:hypothetical protein ABH935_009915 [Catenulispora sp. GAS73]|uniref:helix-turn-helix domain-containing protein n=1 Tax=Catenulispora sp. GAS73 TaxID=3156269 RepID=UPI003511A925